ncbi:MAG: dTDP-glucose 4,6-dehydratase [Pseudomonadota bacterium]
MSNFTVMITGGLGFIGSAVVRRFIRETTAKVVVIDAMTYAAVPDALEEASSSDRYLFEHIDIRDGQRLCESIAGHRPNLIMHLAAESHVDRSIEGPDVFVETNVIGTVNVLQAARSLFDSFDRTERETFRLHHISTDEVFGSLKPGDPAFTETTRYDPRSPYSASKAASDHFVRAWGETYGLPIVLSNCSNNYGPWQYPEKLIPVMISKGYQFQPMPVYGAGENVRDWLHVDDHAEALHLIATRGRIGQSYNVGGAAEKSNLDVVRTICSILDERFPDREPHERLIEFVTDRPGHDFRYAIDFSLIEKELGWHPRHSIESGLHETVNWYLDNTSWWRAILSETGGARRLGLNNAS